MIEWKNKTGNGRLFLTKDGKMVDVESVGEAGTISLIQVPVGIFKAFASTLPDPGNIKISL